jgi:molybdate transport system substrate-binding protein
LLKILKGGMIRLKRLLSILMVFILAVALFGCGNNAPAAPAEEPNSEENAKAENVELMVSAAASLTDSLTEIIESYEKETGVKITPNFAASGPLQKQIEEGAPADIFISASKDKMDTLEEKDLLEEGTRIDLLGNTLVLIVAEEYKDKIKTVDDLVDMDGMLSLGEVESVPAGKYGKQALEHNELWDKLSDKITFAKSVKEVASQVESGAAAAGIVYKSDALLLEKSPIAQEFEEGSHKPIVYPMAVIKNSQNIEEAKKFAEYLKGEEAQSVFEKYGFNAIK